MKTRKRKDSSLCTEMKKVFIKTSTGGDMIDSDTILYMKGSGNCTDIYIENREKPILSSLKISHYEMTLCGKTFIRIHKSYIVNFLKVAKFVNSGDGLVILHNELRLPISRTRRRAFCKFLERLA